jgi:hypothetical protein
MVLPLGMRGVVRRTSRAAKISNCNPGLNPGTTVFYASGYWKQSGKTMQFNSDLKEVS